MHPPFNLHHTQPKGVYSTELQYDFQLGVSFFVGTFFSKNKAMNLTFVER